VTYELVHIEQGLSFYDCHLVGICVERVNVQFIPSCLKIDIAERLKAADSKLGEFYEYAAIAGKFFKVIMALTIEIRTHLLDLEISHIAKTLGECAFVISLSGKSESFNQASAGQRLSRGADEFRKTKVVGENAYYVRTARGPNKRFIFVGLYSAFFIDTEEFRMKRPLVKRKGQFADNNICIRSIHHKTQFRSNLSLF